MLKKAILILFSVECFVLAILLARAWTQYYMSGPSDSTYAAVYLDKLDAGHHRISAEIDAGTTSLAIWWGGVLTILLAVSVGGPAWAYRHLWPTSVNTRMPAHAEGLRA